MVGEVDLNFVDPPIPPEMEPWEPRITPETVAGELAKLATHLRAEELEGELQAGATALEQSDVADAYGRDSRFVARWLTVELDTTTPGKNAIGRFVNPPRFGAKYRKQLRDADARERLGTIAERLILGGFAAGAAIQRNGR